MTQEYDNMAKNLLTDYATEISQFVLGVTDVEVIENIDTEQQIIVGQRTDSTKRIRVNNREAILHIELQLHDSTRKPMWARNAAYHGYLLVNISYLSTLTLFTFTQMRGETTQDSTNIVGKVMNISYNIR